MLELRLYNSFKRDYKKAIARGLDPSKLKAVVDILLEGRELPRKYKDHKLKDDHKYRDMRECHVQPDWLLIYRIEEDALILSLVRIGTHSNLLDK